MLDATLCRIEQGQIDGIEAIDELLPEELSLGSIATGQQPLLSGGRRYATSGIKVFGKPLSSRYLLLAEREEIACRAFELLGRVHFRTFVTVTGVARC